MLRSCSHRSNVQQSQTQTQTKCWWNVQEQFFTKALHHIKRHFFTDPLQGLITLPIIPVFLRLTVDVSTVLITFIIRLTISPVPRRKQEHQVYLVNVSTLLDDFSESHWTVSETLLNLTIIVIMELKQWAAHALDVDRNLNKHWKYRLGSVLDQEECLWWWKSIHVLRELLNYSQEETLPSYVIKKGNWNLTPES